MKDIFEKEKKTRDEVLDEFDKRSKKNMKLPGY